MVLTSTLCSRAGPRAGPLLMCGHGLAQEAQRCLEVSHNIARVAQQGRLGQILYRAPALQNHRWASSNFMCGYGYSRQQSTIGEP